MKNIVFVILILVSGLTANAQMAIGKHKVDGSGIVDFDTDEISGIVLPRVTTIPTGTSLSTGMLIYNALEKKVMYCNGTVWVDLSINAGTVNLTEQNAIPEVAGGTVVGTLSSSALEATDKALILPKTRSPHLNIVKPMAGTICYDTTKKMMCVYNGSK